MKVYISSRKTMSGYLLICVAKFGHLVKVLTVEILKAWLFAFSALLVGWNFETMFRVLQLSRRCSTCFLITFYLVTSAPIAWSSYYIDEGGGYCIECFKKNTFISCIMEKYFVLPSLDFCAWINIFQMSAWRVVLFILTVSKSNFLC